VTVSRPADEPAENATLASEATEGVLWTVLQKWAVRIGGFLTIAILTRLLSPHDFGVVAVALTVLPLLYLLSDFGFASYVIQASEVHPRMLSTAFWYSCGSGILLALGLGFIAGPIGDWLDVSGLSSVLWGCAPAVLFVTFSSVPQALLRRRMAFRALALQSVAGAVAGQIAAIALAVAGFGVWALVGQLVVSEFVVSVAAWVSARWVPRLLFSRHEFMRMASFGTKIVGVEAVGLVRSWGETAIIGNVIGLAGLGYLRIAQRLITVTQDLSAAAIMPVSTVTFARLRDNPERLRRAYMRALTVSYAVVAPIMTVVTVGAPVIIPLLFGSGWTESIHPAQALSIAGILTLGATLDNALCIGTGRPGAWFVYAVAIDALTLGTTAVAVHFGLFGVSIGFVAVAIIATISRWWLVTRLIGTSPRELAAGFGRLGIVLAISGGFGLLAMELTGGLPSLVRLTVTAIAVFITNAAVVRVLMPETYETLDVQLRQRLFRRLGIRVQVA
jgi:O-antigen/teichoic acid export membrane protein